MKKAKENQTEMKKTKTTTNRTEKKCEKKLPLLSEEVPTRCREGGKEWEEREERSATCSLNEILFLFFCVCVVAVGIDDGCVCVRGVIRSFGLICQIRA